MTRSISAALAAAVLLLGTAATARPAPAAPQAARQSRLAPVEDAAEAIAEGEKTGSSARAAAAQAAATWRTVRGTFAPNATTSGVLPAVDVALATLQAQRDPVRTRRAANEVTGALVPLFALAGDGLPGEVHRLDYLSRSIALDAGDANWARAEIDRASLQRSWTALRPRILARPRGSAAAAAYDRAARAVDASVRARDAARSTAAASRSSDAVDGLEKVYAG